MYTLFIFIVSRSLNKSKAMRFLTNLVVEANEHLKAAPLKPQGTEVSKTLKSSSRVSNFLEAIFAMSLVSSTEQFRGKLFSYFEI